MAEALIFRTVLRLISAKYSQLWLLYILCPVSIC